MEKIRKNWHIIIILLLLIISTINIFFNIKFNKKDIKINAEEIPNNYISYNATLNEDLSGKNIRFNIDFIKNLTQEDILNWKGRADYLDTENQFAIYIQLNNYIAIVNVVLRLDTSTYNNWQVVARISTTINNNNNTYKDIYYATKNQNGIYTDLITPDQEQLEQIYTTTNLFNNISTASTEKLNYWNNYLNKFILFEEQETILTPTLTKQLNTLIWDFTQNATFEIWKDNQLLTTTNINRYVAISNGTYKVRAVVSGKYSDYSNEIVISDIEENGQYTFLTLFGNLVDSQLYLIQSMLNFEILGFNLYQFFTAILTICIIIIVCKIALFK